MMWFASLLEDAVLASILCSGNKALFATLNGAQLAIVYYINSAIDCSKSEYVL